MATKQKDQVHECKSSAESRKPYANLDNRYGRIGIPAVAAAVRCKGDTRKSQAAKNKNKHAGHYESD